MWKTKQEKFLPTNKICLKPHFIQKKLYYRKKTKNKMKWKRRKKIAIQVLAPHYQTAKSRKCHVIMQPKCQYFIFFFCINFHSFIRYSCNKMWKKQLLLLSNKFWWNSKDKEREVQNFSFFFQKAKKSTREKKEKKRKKHRIQKIFYVN